MAYWRYFYYHNWRWGTEREECKIVQTQDWFVNLDIHDDSTTTCEDDFEEISYAGYNSQKFAARYISEDRREDNPSSTWYYITVSAGGGTFITVDLMIIVTVKGFTVTGKFKLENTNQNTWVYKYWFAPQHSWSVDYLDSQKLLWAFKLRW